MATDDQVIQLIMKVVGEQEVKSLAKAHQALKADLDAAIRATGSSDAATVAANVNVQNAAKLYLDQAEKIQAATAAVQGHATAIKKGMDQVSSGANSAAYKLQVFGQGIDDLQYVSEQGLRPVINNLMQISPALGIAAIAINSIGIPAFEALTRSMEPKVVGELNDSMKGITARIKELEDKKVKLHVETEELNNAKKIQDALIAGQRTLDAMLGKQTQNEKESGDAINKAIIETPGGQEALDTAKSNYIGKQVDASKDYINQDDAKIGQTKRSLKISRSIARDQSASVESREQAYLDIEREEKLLKKLADDTNARLAEIAGTAEKTFGANLTNATEGKGLKQVDAQRELSSALEAVGPKGREVAAQIRQSSPADMAAKARAEREAKEAKEAAEKADKQDKQSAEEEAARNRVAASEAKEDAKTSKALGRAPKTAAELAKEEAAKDKDRLDAIKAKEAREKELLGVNAPNGANVADLYAQSRMQIDMLPKGQQAKARAALDQQTNALVNQSLLAKGDKAAGLKSSLAASTFGDVFERMRADQQAQVRVPTPKRPMGKRNRAIAQRAAAKRAKMVGPQKVNGAGDKGGADKVVGETKEVKTELEKQTTLLEDIARNSGPARLG